MTQPGKGLRGRPEAHGLRERTVLPQRSAAQHDYVGFDFDEIVVGEMVFGHVADGKIFGDEIALPDDLARDLLRLGHRKIQRDAAARGIDRVENSAAVGADRSVGAGQKSHQVGRARRLDPDYVGAQRAQPRGRVRNGIDPSEVRDPNSFQRPRSLQMISAAASDSRLRIASARFFAKYLLIVLAQTRRSAHDSPRRARELARRPGHPHFARRGMLDIDEKFARLVLLVARDFGRRMHREARHVLRLRLLERLGSRLRR